MTNKAKRRQLRERVLAAYGNACECCGEIRYEFLQMDHRFGGGNRHRRKLKAAGHHDIYKWLVDHSYPPDFRVLCANCNQSLGNYGRCPHGMLADAESLTADPTLLMED